MTEKIILDLCGGSGAWSRPYKEAGYDVHVLTLPEYDVKKCWLNSADKQLEFINQKTGECLLIPVQNVCGVLAAPPCTEFSIAKGGKPRDFAGAMDIVRACMQIVWFCRAYGSLQFWALENPRGFLRQFLGKPAFTFEQWQFGELRKKPTDIWGYFNTPKETVRQMPFQMVGKSRELAKGWAVIECPHEHEQYISQFKGDAKRAALRAITPHGFATAFFRANKP